MASRLVPRARPGKIAAMKPERVEEFFRRLEERLPNPRGELESQSPFTLLIAVVLSAQATDASVNKATPALFAVADTPEKMAALGEARIEDFIRTIGLYRTKAKNIVKLSQMLIAEHGGAVPRTRDALQQLPGVGRKTANVVLNVAFGEPTIAVDTHISRVGNRTGLAPGKNPLQVEQGLEAVTPARYKRYAHHWLILHGPYVCKARRPECPDCVLADLCRYPAKTGPAELIAARAAGGEAEALTEPAAVAFPSRQPSRPRAQRQAAAPR